MSPIAGIGEVVEEAVDEDPLADVEGRLHRFGGDLVRLDQPGLDRQRQAQRQRDDHDQLDQPAGAALRLRDREFQAESSPESPSSSDGSSRHPPPRRRPRSPPPRAPRRPSPPPSRSGSSAAGVSSALGLGLSASASASASSGSSSSASRRVSSASALLGLGLGRLVVAFLDRGLGLADALGVDRLRLVGRGGRRRDQLLVDPPAPLGDPGRLADPAAQVVELGPAHVAAGGDLEFLDLRRVQRERPLDADAEGLLADGEGLARARALALEDDALEDLGAAAAALDTWKWTRTRSPGSKEGRPFLSWPRSMLSMTLLIGSCARREKTAGARTGRRAVAEWYLLRGLFRTARPGRGSAPTRQRRTRSWSPETSTSGTSQPR